MPLIGLDFRIGHRPVGGDQCIDDLAGAAWRKPPVGRERQHQKAALCGAEGRHRVVTVFTGQVEEIQCLCHQNIGVGVEAAGKLATLVAQVTLYLEFRDLLLTQLEAAGTQVATELVGHGIVGQIGDVAYHARQRQPLGRQCVVRQVVALGEVGVGLYSLAGDLVEGNILGAQAQRGSDHDTVAQALRIKQCPAHGLHATQAAPDHGGPAVDTQQVREAGLAVHPVAYPQ